MWWWRLCKRIFLILLVFCASISLVVYLLEDKIIRKVVEQANTYLKVPVHVAQIEVHFWRTFPRISVAFENVQIADPLQEKDTLLAMDQISLRFNPFDLLGGNYHIQQIAAFNGALAIRENENGKVNYDIFKSGGSGSADFDIALKAIFLEQIYLKYQGPKHRYLVQAQIESSTISGRFSATKTKLNATGKVLIERIQKEQLQILKNDPLQFDIALHVDHTQNTIEIPQAAIRLADLPFLIDAQFGPLSNSLDIRSQHLALKDIIQKVSPSKSKALQRMKADGLVDFQLHYQQLQHEDAQIAAYFSIQDGQLTEPKFGAKVEHLQLSGTYKNVPKDFLEIERFTFVSQGAKFNGQLQLHDFARPKLDVNANGTIPLAMIQALYPIAEIQSVAGQVQLQISTQLQANAAQEWHTNTLKGAAQIQATQLQLKDLQKPFTTLSGSVSVVNQAIQIDHCKAQIGQSDLLFELAIPYFQDFTTSGPLEMNGKITANNLHMNDLKSNEPVNKEAHTKQTPRTWVLPSFLNARLPFVIKKLTLDQKTLQHLSGTLRLEPQQIALMDLKMLHAEGQWRGAIEVQEKTPALLDIQTKGSARNLDLKKFFAQWDNFEQTVLTSDQLAGSAQFDFAVSCAYDLYKGLNEGSLQAKVACQIDAGRLYHAPILQDLAATLTFGNNRAILGAKNQAALQRKLQDVRFETLKNTFVIADRKLRFDKIHIASDALDIDLVGQHTFDHNVDYAVALRLRDLVVQETQTEFGQILDDGTGVRLYVRCAGPLDDPKVTWDRNGKKEAAKARFEQSQAESKSMLKTAFGLYQDNPSVAAYQEKTTPHETIRLNFEPVKKPVQPEKKSDPPPKNSKLQQQLDKWKQEQQPATEVKIKVGG